jgi:ribonuclease BN (tRNA processing enzyme)
MNSITFLGTGGARIMLSTQHLATGGMLIKMDDAFFSLDPGPGALVSLFKHGINPATLDGIIASHRHLDHTADINVLIEAMTKGGVLRRGQVFAPADALTVDPVILQYLRRYPEKINQIKADSSYHINSLPFSTSMPLDHGQAETYGFIFHGRTASVGYIADTNYFPQLSDFFQCDILIISMLRLEQSPFLHLAVPDVEQLLQKLTPQVTILTHFGYQVFEKGPGSVAARLAEKTGRKIIAATDGLKYYF